MIFIKYKNNIYYFIHYTQENIFCSIHVIFDKDLFSKYTDFYIIKCKLYNKLLLLDKISLEIKLLVLDPFEKDRSAPVPIPHTLISPIQNNLPTYFSLPSLSYKSTSFPSISESKKPIVEIENDNDIDSDIEI